MISLTDYWIIKLSLSEGILSPERLFPLVSEAFEKKLSIKNLLHQHNIFTQSGWQTLLEKAKNLPSWPEKKEFFDRDNDLIIQYLQEIQVLHPALLQENLTTCQKLYNPSRSLRLDELLFKKGLVKETLLSEEIKIHRAFPLICPTCQYQIRLERHYPWWTVPCLFGPHKLQALTEEKKIHPVTLVQSPLSEEKTQFISPGSFPGGAEKKRIGRYEILELLGEGGMGAVYKAYDPELEREVALKIITDWSGKGFEYLTRFKKEVKLAASLSHPAIIPVYDFGEVEGMPFFTMACIDGKDLRSYVEDRGPLSESQSLKLMGSIAEALSLAHSKGIIHRDIKPENIMITSSGQPVLMDFGLARQAGEERNRLTQTGAIMGSPEFMAPEQALGEGNLTFSADLYGLGGTFFFLLTGQPPFQAKEIYHLLRQVVEEEPPSLTELNPRVRREVESVIRRCLQKNPKDRYSHAEGLLKDLQTLQRGNALQDRPSRKYKGAAGEPKRNPLFVLMGLFLLVVIGLIIALVGQNKKPYRPPHKKNNPPKSEDSKFAISLEKGLKKYRRGEWSEAIKHFEQIPQSSSRYQEARVYKAFSLAYSYQLPKVRGELAQRGKAFPFPDKLRILEGYLLLERAEYAQALQIYQELDQRGVKDPELELGMGLYHWWKKADYQKALPYINKALALAPERLDLMDLRLILLNKHCQEALVIRDAGTYLKIHPQGYPLHFRRSAAFDSLRFRKLSKIDLERVEKLLWVRRKEEPKNLAYLTDYLSSLTAQHKYDQLEEACQKGLSNPQELDLSYLYHYHLANGYWAQQRYDQAKKHFPLAYSLIERMKRDDHIKRAIYCDILYSWAVQLCTTGRLREGELLLNKVRELQPFNSNILYWLSQIQWAMGNHQRSLQMIEDFLDKNPEALNLTYLLYSRYLEMKNFDKLISFSQGIIERLHGHSTGYLIELDGLLLSYHATREKQLLDKILQLSQRGIDLYPRIYFFYYFRGMVRLISEDMGGAMEDFEKAYLHCELPHLKEKARQILQQLKGAKRKSF